MSVGLRLIVIIVAVDIALYMGGYLPVPTYLPDMGITISDNSTYITTSTSYGLFDVNATVAQQSFLTYNDPLGFVFAAIKFTFGTFLFAPLTVMVELPGVPLMLQLMVGVVWSLMLVIATMSFIRGSSF